MTTRNSLSVDLRVMSGKYWSVISHQLLTMMAIIMKQTRNYESADFSSNHDTWNPQIYITCTVLPRSIASRFIVNLAYRQNSHLSRFPPLKIPCYTVKLSYRHPLQVFWHKSRKTNLNSPVNTAHNYLLIAVYWSIIMECQDWSSDTVIDLISWGSEQASCFD